MTTYYDDITIIKVAPGTTTTRAFLTNETHTVACDSIGAVLSFADAKCKMLLYQETTEVSNLWTFSKVDSEGVVSTLSGNEVSLTSMIVDSGTITITAHRSGYVDVTMQMRLVKSYASDPKGDPGDPGQDGLDGQRGTVQIVADISGSTWSNTAATAAIADAGYGTPVNRDIVTLRNLSVNYAESRFYNNGTWLTIGAYVHGNLLVSGTISSREISSDYIYAGEIDAAQVTSGRFSLGVARFGNNGVEPTLFINSSNQEPAGQPQVSFTKGNSNSATVPTLDVSSIGNLSGVAGRAIEARTSNAGALCALFRNTASGREGSIAGGVYAFYAASGDYGPFTGAHDGLFPKEEDWLSVGNIVVDAAPVGRAGMSDVIFSMTASTHPYQKCARGVISRRGALDNDFIPAALRIGSQDIYEDGRVIGRNIIPVENYADLCDEYAHLTVNALGEGQILVCGEGGDIQPGDYIVTSSLRGKGMRMDMSLPVTFDLLSCIVAEAREAATFEGATDVKLIACIYKNG